jgi:hypothetical protein
MMTMSTSITSEKVTDGQKKQVKRFAEDAIDRAVSEGILPDKKSGQKLIENGDEFQTDMLASIRRLSVSNQFADEEVESSYGYLSGYKPKDLIYQTNRLRELIPGVGFACEDIPQRLALPAGAEGWFAIPKWQTLAKTYGKAVQKVFDLIKQTRNGAFYNYREGQLGPQNLRQSAKACKAYEKLCSQQKDHDILVVPCQFGLRHRGRSVRRACEVMPACEFGLGTFEVGIILLTHPERLQHYDDLWIDLAGDEFSDDGDDSFGRAPCFYFDGDRVGFDARGVSYAVDDDGSASAFLPQ